MIDRPIRDQLRKVLVLVLTKKGVKLVVNWDPSFYLFDRRVINQTKEGKFAISSKGKEHELQKFCAWLVFSPRFLH